MKRLLIAFVILSLLLTAPALASTAQQRALDMFDACAFSAEYPDDPDNVQSKLVRWDTPIAVYVSGSPTDADWNTLISFLTDLSRNVPNLPALSITFDESSANLTINFVPLKQMAGVFPTYVDGNWGMFHYTYSKYLITHAEIVVATDVTSQKDRNHLILEEVVGALGLPNDHGLNKKSILYEDWTTVQQLCEEDWIMLNMLYDSRVKPGMNISQAHSALGVSGNDSN